jgi:hypothetical protein
MGNGLTASLFTESEDRMARTPKAKRTAEPTLKERRENRRLRREKQRHDNVNRAANMHAARLAVEGQGQEAKPQALSQQAYVGCSGWFYWKWGALFYPKDLPTKDWFSHYASQFDTVEINASFYAWPTVANVQAWKRQPGKRKSCTP